jgi:hypothetical protein
MVIAGASPGPDLSPLGSNSGDEPSDEPSPPLRRRSMGHQFLEQKRVG